MSLPLWPPWASQVLWDSLCILFASLFPFLPPLSGLFGYVPPPSAVNTEGAGTTLSPPSPLARHSAQQKPQSRVRTRVLRGCVHTTHRGTHLWAGGKAPLSQGSGIINESWDRGNIEPEQCSLRNGEDCITAALATHGGPTVLTRQEIPSWGLTARQGAIPRLESSFSQYTSGTPKSHLTQDWERFHNLSRDAVTETDLESELLGTRGKDGRRNN